MWPRTDLLDLLGIAHPIIQAPMAGSTNPALASAVSNAGGLGSLGCARHDADALRADSEAIRLSSNKPFNLNFFVHSAPVEDEAATAAMQARLAPYFDELDAGAVPDPYPLFTPFDDSILETLLALRPPVVSFHYGLPDPAAMTALKEAGIILLCSATTVAEARELEAGGIDAVIAQGFEAGGHRGTLRPPFENGSVGTMALVPQVADAVTVPVIAAGGIADGRGIAAAFALGASGVQMGTAFLSCPESGVDPVYRAALLEGADDATQVTKVISGRPARGLRNRYVKEMADQEDAALDFPLQYSLSTPLGVASRARGSGDFAAMWAGQSVGLNRVLPAADLVETLVREAEAVLGSS
ncbi:MAG: nitronate monooxygenase family protein [Alphaproteobacteria bacterium]|nr:nitronate monooxygenase family protein [Alphaproteobacteria bacterium]